MEYRKGDFTLVPNKDALRGLDPQTQVLFMWICSYADDEGKCFPSIAKLQTDTGMSRMTVIRRIETLEDKKMLRRQRRVKDGTKTSNLYQIMLAEKNGSTTERLGVVSQSDHPSITEGHRTITNELYPFELYSEQSPQEQKTKFSTEGADLIKAFEEINPAAKKWYSNKTQRAAADRLLQFTDSNGQLLGLAGIKKVIAVLPKANGQPYFPTITTPLQLENKWAQLISAFQRKKAEEKPKSKMAPFGIYADRV